MKQDIEKTVIEALEAQIVRGMPAVCVITETGKVTNFSRIDALPIDSLGLVEFVATIEDEYDIIIGDHECTGAETVGDIVRIVRAKTNRLEIQETIAA